VLAGAPAAGPNAMRYRLNGGVDLDALAPVGWLDMMCAHSCLLLILLVAAAAALLAHLRSCAKYAAAENNNDDDEDECRGRNR
jgi:hypothetical protein